MTPLHSLILLMFFAIVIVGIVQRLKISYPIGLVIGGCALGFIPGLQPIDFDPTTLLALILPPILYYASYTLSFREFLHYFSDIFYLAIFLVILSTVVIAILFKWGFPEASWALAFAFGAIVSPPDAVAATAILKRFALSPRLMTILEGESLINDASALVIYKFSVIAIALGTFSATEASLEAFYAVLGGILLGVMCGHGLHQVTSILNPVLVVVFSFIIPYFTFCLADMLGVSGVLAVVASGLFGANLLIANLHPLTRILGWASWDVLMILMNCFIFILIGLEFRIIIEKMTLLEIARYTAFGLLLTSALILTRFAGIYLRRALLSLRSKKDHSVEERKRTSRQDLITSWAGMRGIVSLTAALALPLVEGRDLVLFLTFEIIFLTLVIPGFTLAPLIKALKIPSCHNLDSLVQAREQLIAVARHEIDLLHLSSRLNLTQKSLLDAYFDSRHEIMEASRSGEDESMEKTRVHILRKQREHLLRLWKENKLGQELMQDLNQELDIEEARLARGMIS